MNIENVDLLAFGAHPDDIELSCAGALAEAVRHGKKIGLVDLTAGEMGTRGTPETRAEEAEAARKVLGASFRATLDFGDGNLRTGRDEELELIRVIRQARPEVIIAPMPDDRHPDHVRAGRLVTEAAFYAGLRKIETGEEAHRPHAVVYYMLNYPHDASFVVDITKSWETKQKTIACYASQFYNPKSNEPQTWIAQKSFLDMIEARARHYGSLIGVEFGEAFVSRQPPRVDDIVAAYRGREIS